MRQQINLYQTVDKDERKPLASRTLGLMSAGVAVSLLVMWGFGVHQVSRLELAVEGLRTQQLAQEQSLTTVSASRPVKVSPAQAEAWVKYLTGQVAARTQALEILRNGGAGRKGGFAARMEALARRHTDGLWIDRIVLSGTTGAMAVSGATMNADLVPRYLRALADESALSGTRFDALTIERNSKSAKTVDGEEAAPADAFRSSKGIRFRAESNSLRPVEPEKAS